MCIMSTPTPKVEKVAPAPTQQTQSETAAVKDRINADAKRRRVAAGTVGGSAQGSRVVANSMLGQAQSGTGTKSRLGD